MLLDLNPAAVNQPLCISLPHINIDKNSAEIEAFVINQNIHVFAYPSKSHLFTKLVYSETYKSMFKNNKFFNSVWMILLNIAD